MAIAGSPFQDGGGTAVVVDRTGGYVYVAGVNVAAFARDQNTGALTEFANFGMGPLSSLAVDASGGYLYVLDNVTPDVQGFSIDPSTGSLTTVTGSPLALIAGGAKGLGSTVIVTSR